MLLLYKGPLCAFELPKREADNVPRLSECPILGTAPAPVLFGSRVGSVHGTNSRALCTA